MSPFAKDVFERALKTFAQTLVALFAGGVTILSIDWRQALALAGTAALTSILSSLSTNTFTSSRTASLVKPSMLLPGYVIEKKPVD